MRLDGEISWEEAYLLNDMGPLGCGNWLASSG